MRMRSDAEIAESVWPAVERAIRPAPIRARGMDWHTAHVTALFTGAIIRRRAFELTEAGARLPDEC